MSIGKFVTKSGQSWNWCRAGAGGMRFGKVGSHCAALYRTLNKGRDTEQSVTPLRKAGVTGIFIAISTHAGDGNVSAACSHLVIVSMSTPEAFGAQKEQRSYSSSHSFTSYVHSVHSLEGNTPGEMLGIQTFRHIAQQG